MGGGGGTPGPTAEEKKLAQLANDKYDLAKGIDAGTNYLTQDASVDRTARYTERALGDTARLLGTNQTETPVAPVTGPVDLTANLSAINAGKTQSDLDSQAKQTGLAQASLGTVADTSSALHQEGLRKQAVEQAESEYKAASTGSIINAAASIGTAYAMNHKKVNAKVAGLFSKKPALKINTPWGGR